MIQNPELAQSFILLSVLRQERDRLLTKSSSIPDLNSEINKLTHALNQKVQRSRQEQEGRKGMIGELKGKLQGQLGRKGRAGLFAEGKMGELRGYVNGIRKIKKEIMEIRKQIEQTNRESEQLDEGLEEGIKIISREDNQLKQLQSIKHELQSQIEIGKARVRQQFEQYNRLRNSATESLSYSISLQQQIGHRTGQLHQCHLKAESLENQIYNKRIQICKEEQQQQEKMTRIENLRKMLVSMERNCQGGLEECNQLLKTVDELENKLEDQYKQCRTLNGEVVTLSAKGNSLERDNKLIIHRIECIQMLIKRLYGCRDRMIEMRRNNASRSRETGNLSGRGSMGRLSRMEAGLNSEVSIFLKTQSPIKEQKME